MDDLSPRKVIYDLSENEDLRNGLKESSFNEFEISMVLDEREVSIHVEPDNHFAIEEKQMGSQTTTTSYVIKEYYKPIEDKTKLRKALLYEELANLERKILLQRQTTGFTPKQIEKRIDNCAEFIPLFTDLANKIDDFRYTYFARSDTLREENKNKQIMVRHKMKQLAQLEKVLLKMSIKFSETRKKAQKKSNTGFFRNLFFN